MTHSFRWAVADEYETLGDLWYRMVCDMSPRDGVPIPTPERVEGVKAMFRAETLAGRLVHRVACDGSGAVIACAGGLLREEYPFPLATEPVPFGWVINVYTLPAFRGQGLASRLVDDVCGWLRERGARRARLWASSEGHSVYAKLGFRQMMDMEKPLV